MREILFRGKRIDNGEWWYGLPLRTLNKDGEDVLNIQCWERDEDGVTGIYDPVTPDTIGQFTGLTDKNGKKIFEGDIVSRFINWLGQKVNGVIEYDTEVASWVCRPLNIESKVSTFLADWLHGNDAEIIGNIHDNPELLEADK